MRVLVLGAKGMIGHTVFAAFNGDPEFEAWGTLRDASGRRWFHEKCHGRLIAGVDVLDQDCLARTMRIARPDVIVNAVGVVKQLDAARDPLTAIPINALFPHRLALLAGLAGARVIQISTDCVFLGATGNYREIDRPDADDLYGRSKYLGEIHNQEHVITLRTSTIGHETGSRHGLLEWFLHQTEVANGYTRAIFSGIPTIEFARVVKDIVCRRRDLHGLFHVSGDAINKYDFLKLVADEYGRKIEIRALDDPAIDRSLDGQRFRSATGYAADAWPVLVARMHAHHQSEVNA